MCERAEEAVAATEPFFLAGGSEWDLQQCLATATGMAGLNLLQQPQQQHEPQTPEAADAAGTEGESSSAVKTKLAPLPPGACFLFGRKFPADTAPAVLEVARDCGNGLWLLGQPWCRQELQADRGG